MLFFFFFKQNTSYEVRIIDWSSDVCSSDLFVPHHSRWPLFASVALFVTMYGLASLFNEDSYGKATFFVGIAGMIVILFKWFADVILESVSGYYNNQVDGTFRMGRV